MTSLVRRSGILLVGEGAARFLGAVTFAVLARRLGAHDFGIFSFAMSFALVAGMAIDLGQNTHLGRVVARDPVRGPSAFAAVATNKLWLSFCVLLAGLGVLTLLGFSSLEVATTGTMLLWSIALTQLDSLRAVARSLGLMAADSCLNGLESAGRLGVVLAASALGLPLLGYAAAFALEAVVAFSGFFVFLSGRVNLGVGVRGQARVVLRDSVSVGLASAALTGFYRVDQLFVEPLAGAVASGLYGTAARIVFTATVVAGMIVAAAYPEMAKRQHDCAAFASVVRRAVLLCGSVGIALTIGMAIFARPVIVVLFGVEYNGAVGLLRVLSPVAALNALVAVFYYAGNALGRERLVLRVVAVMLVANIVANLALIPAYGVYAAAWISVIGELLMVSGLALAVRDRLGLGARGLAPDTPC